MVGDDDCSPETPDDQPLTGIPVDSGVQLIGERGKLGSRPVLYTNYRDEGYPLFQIEDYDVRVEGLHLVGPYRPRDRKKALESVKAIEVIEDPEGPRGSIAIADNEIAYFTNAVDLVGTIEEDEPSGYDKACESPPCSHLTREDARLVRVERNYIHHNQMKGGGYGVVVGGGAYATAEGNVFEFNNHSIAASGHAYSGYVARFNYVLGGVNTFGSDDTYPHHFDVHGRGSASERKYVGGGAGTYFEIALNTFRGEQDYGFLGRLTRAAFKLRGTPAEGAYFRSNVLVHDDLDEAVEVKGRRFYGGGNRFDTDFSTEIASGDFDGDRRADVFVANGTGWFISRAGIRPWEFLRASNKRIRDLRFADMTGDGVSDVLYRDPTGRLGYVASGTAPQVTPLTSSPVAIEDLRFGDFDGDRRTDIFYTRAGQWHIWYARTGAWAVAGSSSQPLSGLLFGEFDEVRGTDVAAVSRAAWSYSSAATGGWARLNRKLTDSFATAVAADFDGNGKTDIAFGDSKRWRFSRDGRSPLARLREGSVSRPYGPLKQLLIDRFDGGTRATVVGFVPKQNGLRIVPGERLGMWRGLGGPDALVTRSSQNMR